MKVLLFSYLLVNAWTDLKRKEIDLLYTIIFIGIGMVYKYIVLGIHYWSGMIPGLMLLGFSLIWKEQIGMGDGIVVMVSGWMSGLSFVCEVLMGGFLLAAGVGILGCIVGRKKNVELPFVPFFLGSYVLNIVGKGAI